MLVIIVSALVGMITFGTGFFWGLKYYHVEIVKMVNLASKSLELFEIAVWWIKNPQKISEYVNQKKYKKVAIYGMSHLGDCLENTLRSSGIEVVCGIDKNASQLYNPYIPIYNLENKLPVVDVVIITTIICFEQIKHELQGLYGGNIDIVSLEEILYK